MAYEPFKATFEVGARVKVVKQRKYPGEKLLGLVGTVRSDSGSNVAVVLDKITNTRSSYGCFYFKPVELVEVDEFDNEIVKEKNMEKITGYLNCVKVAFNGADKPSGYYYANFESDLKVGELCIVKYGSRMDVATVVEIIDATVETYNEVVAKVYTDDYNARVKIRARAAELKAKMEARAKQLQDIALYQMLAKDDPDMATLLDEYQGLPKF